MGFDRSVAIRAFIAASSIGVLAGCAATTIVPPAAPSDPVPVFILDHGRHTTLVLPHPQGMARYAYGDWAWYAQVDTGVVEASRALLWPSPAAFGRRLLNGPPTAAAVRREVRVGIEHLHAVTVEAQRAEALRKELDARFFAGEGRRFENRAYDLTFVPDPQRYTVWRNSNHKVAEWLRQLGCSIRGGPFWAHWRVLDPAPDGAGRAALVTCCPTRIRVRPRPGGSRVARPGLPG